VNLCSRNSPYSLNCHIGAMLVFHMLCRITQSSEAHRTESVSVVTDGSWRDNDSEFQSVGPETAKHTASHAPSTINCQHQMLLDTTTDNMVSLAWFLLLILQYNNNHHLVINYVQCLYKTYEHVKWQNVISECRHKYRTSCKAQMCNKSACIKTQ